MPVVGNYIAGSILYAANLNACFLQAVSIAGDGFQGTVSAPNLIITQNILTSTITANTSVAIQGFDVKSAIQQASANANAAFITANAASGNSGATLAQAAFNQANLALNTANGALSNSGGNIVGALTINNILNVSNTITDNAEMHL